MHYQPCTRAHAILRVMLPHAHAACTMAKYACVKDGSGQVKGLLSEQYVMQEAARGGS